MKRTLLTLSLAALFALGVASAQPACSKATVPIFSDNRPESASPVNRIVFAVKPGRIGWSLQPSLPASGCRTIHRSMRASISASIRCQVILVFDGVTGQEAERFQAGEIVLNLQEIDGLISLVVQVEDCIWGDGVFTAHSGAADPALLSGGNHSISAQSAGY
jgi:hypothetical protein